METMLHKLWINIIQINLLFYSLAQLYKKDVIEERHRHRYEVNPEYVERLEAAGLRFVGKDDTKTRMEVAIVENHPFYVSVQFHPEYLSRPLSPSPPFLG